MKILIVEDDINLLETLRYNFTREGYDVIPATDGAEAIEKARSREPDIIVLDLMLPVMSGIEVCRVLRKEMTVPIIMLTAKAEETDKVIGLELGADDYITKPFSMRELLARVRAALRRIDMSGAQPAVGQRVIRIDGLEIDIARHRVTRDTNAIELSPKEFDLLAFLAANRGFVFTREKLLEKVWGYDFAGDTRTVDVHIRWLRQKVEADPMKPRLIITIRGTGYKLEG
jgi:DNA-binding response OmpR family regulator